MSLETRRSLSVPKILVALAWFVCAQGVSSSFAQGGFVDAATSGGLRPRFSTAQIQSFVPARGPFTFPAPYGTAGARITNAGEIVIHSDEFRDQPKNIQSCRDKLREMLLAVLRPPKKRRPTKPTKGSKVRRLKDKKARSQLKAGRRYSGE